MNDKDLLHFLSADFLAFIRVLQAFFFIIVILIQNKSLKYQHAIIIIRKVGSVFAFVIFKDWKIFDPDDLVQFLDVYSINCVTIVANQDTF